MLGRPMNNIHPQKIRKLQDLTVSALALGTYLGNHDEFTNGQYKEALTTAISLGCNFVDTAINYRCQLSERMIGECLKNLFDQKICDRQKVVVATKGGFIPFDQKPPIDFESYVEEKWIKPGIITWDDIVEGCHSLHPSYIQDQINTSLTNLGLKYVDVYYLHNPETQLSQISLEIFYQRVRKAFEVLEKNVSQGKIKYYGLATWTAFREPHSLTETISLEKVVEIATEVGGKEHHFKAIQLPYNLAMLEAVSVENQMYQEKLETIFPVANHFGISVMISAPLLQSQLAKLPAPVAEKMPGEGSPSQKALQFVTSTPLVCSAMVGMKSVNHVKENLAILKEPNWSLEMLQKICKNLVEG